MTGANINAKTFGYVRVSSKEQNEARQLDTMQALGIEERDIYVDKASGKDTDRVQYQALKTIARRGDTIVFDSISRMSRDMKDTEREYQYFVDSGINMRFINEPMLDTDASDDTDDVIKQAMSKIILTLLSAFNEKERTDTHKRQAEGIAAARKRGQRLGRPSIDYTTLDSEQRTLFNEQYRRWKEGKQTAVKTFTNIGLTKNTFYKIVKQYEEQAGVGK